MPGLPIRVNSFSIVHTVGYLSLFLANHWLVFRGQAKASDLAILAGVTFVYLLASIWFAQSPYLLVAWLFALELAISLESYFPNWPKRIFAKKR